MTKLKIETKKLKSIAGKMLRDKVRRGNIRAQCDILDLGDGPEQEGEQ